MSLPWIRLYTNVPAERKETNRITLSEAIPCPACGVNRAMEAA
jgi:hypothetical protein